MDFKELLDDKELSKNAGIFLAYIGSEEQQQICDYVVGNDIKINISQAEQLKQLFASGSFSLAEMEKIFLGKKKSKSTKPKKVVQISRKILENYFADSESEEHITKEIVTALDFYNEHKDRV